MPAAAAMVPLAPHYLPANALPVIAVRENAKILLLSTVTVLPWNLVSSDPASQIQFRANETKTFIAKVTSNVRGFNLIFYPMTDFTVTCTLQMPLKPDGNPYSTTFGTTLTLLGIYDSRTTFNIWTTAMGRANVLDPFVYPGDFILTCTADKAGWGFLNTNLFQ